MSHRPAALDSVRAQRRFFVGVSGLFLAMALVGFAPSFFLKVVFEHPGAIVEQAEILRRDAGEDGLGVPRLPLYVVVHGALSTAWFVLFFAQTLLISSGRRAVHQTLGVGGLVIAAGVVVSGVTAVVLAIPRLITLRGPSGSFGRHRGAAARLLRRPQHVCGLRGRRRRCRLFSAPARDAQVPDVAGDDDPCSCTERSHLGMVRCGERVGVLAPSDRERSARPDHRKRLARTSKNTLGSPGRVRLRRSAVRCHVRTWQYTLRAVVGARVDELMRVASVTGRRDAREEDRWGPQRI